MRKLWLFVAALGIMTHNTWAAGPMPTPADVMEKAAEVMKHGAAVVSKPLDHMQVVGSAQRPFPPSYITTHKGNALLSESDFEDPAICAGCHPKQYEGWKGSMHANAFKDPVFQKLWDMGEKATGGKLMNHCGGCHSPIGVASQTIKHDPVKGEFTAGPIASQGVSCDVCHTMTKTNFLQTESLEHGNASFHMEPMGPGGPKRGPLKDAASPYHATEYSELHKKADFCGNCHNIFNPESGFPVERTYDEWKYSAYAREGIVCQDCHMNSVDTAIAVAREMKRPEDIESVNLKGFAGMGASQQREVVHEHGFVGGNTVVTGLLNGDESMNKAEAIKRLQNAAELKLALHQRKDGLYDLKATVYNRAAGHNLPTSLTDVREVWLEVTVTDNNGKVLYTSGHLGGNGEMDYENTTIFNAVAINKEGKETHLPWEVYQFVKNTTIPPKGHSTSNYTFAAPDGSKGFKVDVKLNYRSYSQYLADKILGKGTIKIPVIEMEHETMEHKI